MQKLTFQAKGSELIQYATEIKVGAERRCGELLVRKEKNRGAAAMPGSQHTGKVVHSDATTASTLAGTL